MAIKKYSKVKFTLRKELIIILAAIVVLVVATILLNLPNEEEKFLEKWNNAGAQISENRLYEEVTIDELNQILASKKADETTFVFFATPENADSVTYFTQVVNHANTHDVSKVYLVDSAFAIGTREEGNDLDKQLSEIEAKFNEDLVQLLKDEYCVSSIFSESPNFSKLTNDNCWTTQLVHQTKLIIDKKGVEGAAVTIMANGATGAPDQEYKKIYYDFILDQAFGFIITQNDSVLFSGVVKNL